MTRLYIITFLLLGHLAFGQNKYPTKSQLQKALTKNTKLKGHRYNSTNWFSLESDSSYKNADTLVFYNNRKYQNEKFICHFVDWNFYKQDGFWIQRVQLCKEPASATAIKDEDIFTFKIVDKQQPMVLQVYNKEVLVDQFEVLAFKRQQLHNRDNETTDVLTLRRIKLNQTTSNLQPTAAFSNSGLTAMAELNIFRQL